MLKIKKEILEEFDDNFITEAIMDIADRVRTATLDEVEKAIDRAGIRYMKNGGCPKESYVDEEDMKEIIAKLRKKK